MTIHLPGDVERSIEAAVRNGRFVSVDEAMTRAAHLLLREMGQAPDTLTSGSHTEPASDSASPHESAGEAKPIWEVADDIRKSVPAEEWARLPSDGARQLDHYLYGSPKRPSS